MPEEELGLVGLELMSVGMGNKKGETSAIPKSDPKRWAVSYASMLEQKNRGQSSKERDQSVSVKGN